MITDRVKIRRTGGRVFRNRHTMHWIEQVVDDIFNAQDLPPLGGMKSDIDGTPTAASD